ncbi:MAG: NADPH:quinone reductase, partial [Nitrospinaceae bacterium]|nr:NADPH:quinone reductase [Nitrospinaceae bacterium]
MKAIHVHEFGGPEVMKFEDAADPTAGAGQILVDMRAAGVNPVDTTFRSGAHPLSKSLELPWTPGIDAAGEVIEVGAGVEGFKAGDRVFGAAMSGGYAEKATLNALRTAHIPSNLSFEDCASFPVVLYTAFYAVVVKGGIQPGQTFLIHAGAGGVGSMAIQIAKASGAKVITTVSSKEKGDVAASLGADVVVNYRDEDFASRCASETGGQGVDAVIEMVATENFDGSCRALKKGGTMVLLGSGTGKNPTGSISYPPFYSKDIDVRGMSLFNADSVFPDMLRQVNHLLEAGMVRPLLGEVIPIAEAARAHDGLMTGKVAGKI